MPLSVFALIIAAVLMSAVGQMALKIAVERAHLKQAIAAGFMSALAAAAASPYLWGALLIYAASVVLWLWALSEADVSVAYPFVSLGFVLTMVFAAIFLNESVTPLKLSGTLLIVAGCILVARSA